MPRYAYTALVGSKKVQGEVEAPSKAEALRLLRRNGFGTVLALEEVRARAVKRARISPASLAQFYRILGMLLGSGVDLREALESLSDGPQYGKVARAMLESLRQTPTLSVAAERVGLPTPHVWAIRAAEESGKLERVLAQLAEEVEANSELSAEVKGAATYPVAILSFILLLVYGLLTGMVPRFIGVLESMGYTRADMPWYSRVLVALADLLRDNGPLLFLGAVGLAFAFLAWSRTNPGQEVLDRFFFRLPLISRLRQNLILSRFLRTFSLLIEAGVNIRETLTIGAQVAGSATYRQKINAIKERVEKGFSVTRAFQEAKFPREVVSLIKTAEQASLSSVVPLLMSYAVFLQEETKRAVRSLSKLIEPALIVVMAVVVGGLLLGVFVPFYDAIQKLREKMQ